MPKRSAKAGALLLFPGAGSSSSHPSLVAIEEALAPLPVARADFPYRRGGPSRSRPGAEAARRVVEEAGLLAERAGVDSRPDRAGRPLDGRPDVLDGGGRRAARRGARADLVSTAPAGQARAAARRALPAARASRACSSPAPVTRSARPASSRPTPPRSRARSPTCGSTAGRHDLKGADGEIASMVVELADLDLSAHQRSSWSDEDGDGRAQREADVVDEPREHVVGHADAAVVHVLRRARTDRSCRGCRRRRSRCSKSARSVV